MKILILGDFSAVNYQLWLSMVNHGITVDFYSRGDGYKNIPSDKRFIIRKPGENAFVGALREIGNQLFTLPNLRNYDIVLMHSARQFHNRINKSLIRYVLNNNDHFVIQHMACTNAYHRFVETLEYSPCAECAQLDHGGIPCNVLEYEDQNWEEYLYSRAAAIVCTGYEYLEGMRQMTPFGNRTVAIPLPVNLSEHPFEPLPSEGKIRIFYGINRNGFKGSKHIIPALEKIRQTHGDRAEVVIAERLPYEEYKQVLRNTHVVVDQCNSYSYGMNAVISLARGKVVATGAEPVALTAMGFAQNPALINIRPDANQIWQSMANLVELGPSVLADMGRQGHAFAVSYHGSDAVLKQYITLFRDIISN